MATSFKKKGTRGRVVYPPGTRPSLHNNQLLISSGVPSLDNVIGEFITDVKIYLISSLILRVSTGNPENRGDLF